MSETVTNNNQLAVIENSIEVLKTGPEILANNQQRKDKALAVGRNILTAIQENGMDAELDETAKNYLIKVNDAINDMKERRSAVTQIMDELKKMYTVVEAELDPKLDPKKPATVPAQIQAARDTYARQLAEEAERKRKEAEREAARKTEAIEIRAHAEKQLSAMFNEWLLSKKKAMTEFFNGLTLETFDAGEERLKTATIKATWKPEGNMALFFPRYHSNDEIQTMNLDVFNNMVGDFENTTVAELTLLRDELIEKLPSKKAELIEQKRLADEAAAEAERARIAEEERQEAIQKANAEEKARLEEEAEKARQEDAKRQAELKAQQDAAAAEQKRREEEEAARLAAEAEEARKKAEMDADLKKQGEQTMAMFEKEAAIAETVEAPEVRQGYEIEVLHPVGYTQIFALYFDKEGSKLPVDKLGNMKLDQMKAWCEKAAHKSGLFIESKFLKYNETYKAINRKAK